MTSSMEAEPSAIPLAKLIAVTPTAEGLMAARALSRWELGTTVWADRLIHAYLNPEETMGQIALEQVAS